MSGFWTAGGGSAPCYNYWSGFAGADAAPDGTTRCTVNSAAPEAPKMPFIPGLPPGLTSTVRVKVIASPLTIPVNVMVRSCPGSWHLKVILLPLPQSRLRELLPWNWKTGRLSRAA
jgi:hypothetical protein